MGTNLGGPGASPLTLALIDIILVLPFAYRAIDCEPAVGRRRDARRRGPQPGRRLAADDLPGGRPQHPGRDPVGVGPRRRARPRRVHDLVAAVLRHAPGRDLPARQTRSVRRGRGLAVRPRLRVRPAVHHRPLRRRVPARTSALPRRSQRHDRTDPPCRRTPAAASPSSSRTCTAGTARSTPSTGCRSTSRRASSSRCSGRRAAARRRRCERSPGSTSPMPGRILVDGKDITHVPANKRDMGMVFQAYSLFPNMTARDNVAYGLRLRGVDKASAASAGRRDARPRRARAAGRPLPVPALRRPAAAGRPRPGARDRAEGAAPRRAALGARREGPPAAARGDPADPDRRRHHDAVRDPRPGGGAGARRSGRRDVGRPARADRRAGRALRPPGDRLRGRVRRAHQSAARRSRATASSRSSGHESRSSRDRSRPARSWRSCAPRP